MITSTGKTILSKFLLGQTSTYASHIAIGCGAQPLLSTDTLADYSAQTSMIFEMLRVPIISRGYIYEDNMDKIVFTAELPTSERYEITELALFSGGSDSIAANPSKNIFAFSNNENWEYHDASSAIAVPEVSFNLAQTSESATPDLQGDFSAPNYYLFATADNEFFNITTRLARQERPRYLNSTLMLAGNLYGTITSGALGSLWTYTTDSTHLHLTNLYLQDLDKNSSEDELRLAFSLISTSTATTATPNVKILVEFLDTHNSSKKAQFQYEGTSSASNRYVVATQTLSSMYRSNDFTWDSVNVAKIYVDVAGPETYYVAFDGMRIENTSSNNPLYGMTGYTVIKNTYTDSANNQYAKPIIKNVNTSNLVEFRIGIDVV